MELIEVIKKIQHHEKLHAFHNVIQNAKHSYPLPRMTALMWTWLVCIFGSGVYLQLNNTPKIFGGVQVRQVGQQTIL